MVNQKMAISGKFAVNGVKATSSWCPWSQGDLRPNSYLILETTQRTHEMAEMIKSVLSTAIDIHKQTRDGKTGDPLKNMGDMDHWG